MKLEKRFAYMVLGTLGLAACGGGDSSGGGQAVEGGGGMAGEGTGGRNGSGGRSGSGGAREGSGGETGTGGGTASGGAGSGGEAADGGPDGAPSAGGAPGAGGAAPADGGTDPDGASPDGATPDAGPLPDPAGVVAFAYAGSASAGAPYAPSANYSYNASGGAISIDRNSVGNYTVTFEGLDPPIRNAQVTAYAHPGYCIVLSFGSTSATVRCYDNDGVLADAEFSLVAFGPAVTGASVVAYAFAGSESAAQYGANASYSYSQADASITARRSQPGTYTLELSGLSLSTGNVQVRAVDSNHHCSVVSWTGNTVSTICYNELGARADTKYLAMVTKSSDSPVRVLGYAHSISSTDATNDLTGGQNTYNATGGSVVAERTGTGAYTVTFTGADFSTSHPQVSARTGDRYCGVNQWGGNWVRVGCVNATGAATDSLYSLVVVE